ncbi:ATP-binding cassette domain-containing protein, partial [Staphylococcus epidermidis]
DSQNKILYSTQNLHLSYPQNHPLQNINLHIFQNNLTAIIPPSPSPKSTYIKALNTILQLLPSLKTPRKIFYPHQNIFHPNYSKQNLPTNLPILFQQPNPFPNS